MKKAQRKQFLYDNFKLRTLKFTWTNSGVVRIVNLRGEKTKYHAGGYGYDKQGTCLAELINDHFTNELKKLDSKDYYGLSHYNTKTNKYQRKSSKYTRSSVNGGCGFGSMENILNKIGFNLRFIYEDKDCTMYRLEE
tara:strand:+ start:5190 stop:5600 length:411 start_codon:yes stop_codon:yes gene_type:complete